MSKTFARVTVEGQNFTCNCIRSVLRSGTERVTIENAQAILLQTVAQKDPAIADAMCAALEQTVQLQKNICVLLSDRFCNLRDCKVGTHLRATSITQDTACFTATRCLGKRASYKLYTILEPNIRLHLSVETNTTAGFDTTPAMRTISWGDELFSATRAWNDAFYAPAGSMQHGTADATLTHLMATMRAARGALRLGDHLHPWLHMMPLCGANGTATQKLIAAYGNIAAATQSPAAYRANEAQRALQTVIDNAKRTISDIESQWGLSAGTLTPSTPCDALVQPLPRSLVVRDGHVITADGQLVNDGTSSESSGPRTDMAPSAPKTMSPQQLQALSRAIANGEHDPADPTLDVKLLSDAAADAVRKARVAASTASAGPTVRELTRRRLVEISEAIVNGDHDPNDESLNPDFLTDRAAAIVRRARNTINNSDPLPGQPDKMTRALLNAAIVNGDRDPRDPTINVELLDEAAAAVVRRARKSGPIGAEAPLQQKQNEEWTPLGATQCFS